MTREDVKRHPGIIDAPSKRWSALPVHTAFPLYDCNSFPPCPPDAQNALLDGETPLHSVRRVDMDALPGPYPQIDRDRAHAHGLWLGCDETTRPEWRRVGVLVTGDRLTFEEDQ